MSILGIIGMVLIVSAWIVSIDSVPSMRLSILYGLGSLFLAIHSYIIGDAVFLILNVLSFAISVFNIYRGLRKKQISR
jgi:MtN3 and saliva related transmembrane protein